MSITISPAKPEHFSALRAIELAAFETLRNAGGVTGIASANAAEAFNDYAQHGVLHAAFSPEGIPVGFAAGLIEDCWLHVAEMDVHPDWQRRGIGRRLMQTLLVAGRQRGLAGATLTTDSEAAFNAPFYATLGFAIVKEGLRPPHLSRLNAEEIAAGFDPTRRVTMLMRFETLK